MIEQISEGFYSFASFLLELIKGELLKWTGGNMNKDHKRHALRIAVGIIMLILLMAGGVGAATPINACTTISLPGEYVLNSSIIESNAIRCINIASSNVTFDGAGYTIDGNGNTSSVGVSISSPDLSEGLINVSVKNLKLTDWGTGISSAGSMFSYGNMYGNISNNTINTYFGISILYSENYTIANNNAGIYLRRSSGNTIIENNASSKGGIYIIYSYNNILIKNDISSNEHGIYMSYAQGNIIANNRITGSTYSGISLSQPWARNNTIINNYLSLNKCGIDLVGSSTNNTIAGNKIISNSDCGISVASSGNLIYNNFFNNSNSVVASENNIWNITKTPGINIIGGPYLGGNYWAYPNGTGFSLTCTDANKDGICDTNYTPASGNIDYFPLAAIPSGYGFMSGSVYNSTGIAGAIVSTNTSNSTTSDASGIYALLVPAGMYNLTVKKEPEYYSNRSVAVTAISGTTIPQDIELSKKQTGNITGSVTG